MDKEKFQLLLVEDEVLLAMRMKRNLELFGYQVHAPVATGQAAIDSVAQQQPDAIFMDIRMPGGMDGIQAAQAIREQYDIPIIFMTGYSNPEIVERARAVNPVAILEKPLLFNQIEAAIEAALRKETQTGL